MNKSRSNHDFAVLLFSLLFCQKKTTIIVLFLEIKFYLIYDRDVSRAFNPETFTVDPSLAQTTMSTTAAQTMFVRTYSIDDCSEL